MSANRSAPKIADVREEDAKVTTAVKADGFDVLIATPQDFFIDLDDSAKHSQFIEGLDLFIKTMPGSNIALRAWPSKSGRIHVWLRCEGERFTASQRVAWQLALGSDPERERWVWIKACLEDPDGSKLFRPKGEKGAPILLNCVLCGLQALTHKVYMAQMLRPDSRWECPRCGQSPCGVVEV